MSRPLRIRKPAQDSGRAWGVGVLAPLLAALLLHTPAFAQDAFQKRGSMSVYATLAQPDPECSVTASSLSLGSYYRPLSGSAGSASVSAVDGSPTSSGGMLRSSSGSAGSATLAAKYADSATVTISFPSSLGSGGPSFTGSWAQRSSNTSKYEAISGTSYTVDDPTAHHFQIGGSVSGISLSTAAKTHSGTISVTVTCS